MKPLHFVTDLFWNAFIVCEVRVPEWSPFSEGSRETRGSGSHRIHWVSLLLRQGLFEHFVPDMASIIGASQAKMFGAVILEGVLVCSGFYIHRKMRLVLHRLDIWLCLFLLNPFTVGWHSLDSLCLWIRPHFLRHSLDSLYLLLNGGRFPRLFVSGFLLLIFHGEVTFCLLWIRLIRFYRHFFCLLLKLVLGCFYRLLDVSLRLWARRGSFTLGSARTSKLHYFVNVLVVLFFCYVQVMVDNSQDLELKFL